MSHPLIVEAAETLFVPVCVYNNTKGDADARWREAFDEPAWNNPVVRVVDAAHEDLVPRIDRDWTVAGLASAMVRVLNERAAARGEDAPGAPTWLRLLAEESTARRVGLETAIFGMG